MSTNFVIKFEISELEWHRSAKKRTEPGAEPIFDAFYGNIRIMAGEEDLFAGRNYHMSVADLAVGLCTILQEGFPGEAAQSKATFRQGDDALEIYFDHDGNNVVVSCNIGAGHILHVSREDFLEGAAAFIKEFTREVVKKVPKALEWQDLQELRPYICEEKRG